MDDEKNNEIPNDGEDDINFSPFFEYLKTENGHQIASKILTIIDDVKKATLSNTTGSIKLFAWHKIIIVALVVIAATILTMFDKFNPTVGVLFGTLIGYVFGKTKNS